MRESRGLLILLVVVVLTAGLVWFFTRPKPPAPSEVAPEPDAPVPFHFAEVPVRSPDLVVEELQVSGAVAGNHTSWVVTATCAEPEGCVGELLAEVRFLSENGKGEIRLLGEFDVPSGDVLRFEGLQNGYHSVEEIDRVAIEVRSREVMDYSSGEVEL